MATTEQLESRLQYQSGADRARMVARHLTSTSWQGHQLNELVIMRSDLDGFREWVAESKTQGSPPHLAFDFLRLSIELIRRMTLQHGGLFERQHGDRTTSIFASDELLPGDSLQDQGAWIRATACGVLVLREHVVLVQEWAKKNGSRPPALRLGITGFSGEAGVGQVVNAVSEPLTQPPEIFSVGYENTEGDFRCLHSIADGLCEIASDEVGWIAIHENLNDSVAKEAAVLWRAIVRGRRDGMLLVDHTHATAEFVSTLESVVAKSHPQLSHFSFIRPSVRAWDPRNGERKVALAKFDNNV